MSIVEIFLIAIGLSMDAFAVSITLGLSDKKLKMAKFLLPGIYFGFFQALMPFIGFYGGKYFTGEIQILDHWIAFVLLAFIGGKMIKESFEKKEEKANENSYKFTRMLLLAVSTSIDALAVGITFAFFRINIFMAIIIIGLTTFIISIAGAKIGDVFGIKFKSKAEIFGGAILVMLGIKILIEHLFFSPA
jgi:putative Mn2+ efflux pump MntP